MLVRALIFVWALLCFSAGIDSTGNEWTERQLKQSQLWKNDQVPLILTKSGYFPESFLKALEQAINGSKVIHVKVACLGTSADDDVCSSLTNQLLVRQDGAVEGLETVSDIKSESEFVSTVLQLLLSSSITQLWSYNDLTNYSQLHPQYLITLAPNSEEYVALLSALLKWPIPLGVAMTAGVLPLSQRQQYMPPPSLLQLWYVVQGQPLYSNQDMTGFGQHVVQKCKKHVQLVREFVERVHYPIVVRYKDDVTLRKQFATSGLHIAIVFPGLRGANETEPKSLAVNVAQATFMNYAFIIMPDRSRLWRFVMDSKPSPYVIVLPYGLKTDLMRWAVEGKDIVSEVRQITYTLRAYAVEHPRLQDGQEMYDELGPSINHVSEIKKKVATRKHHIFAYFCLQGSQQCIKTGYKIVHELLSVVRVTELGQSLGAHVVLHNQANIKPLKLKNLSTCAMYNRSTKAWTVAQEEITLSSKALQFISELTEMSELWEIGRVMSHVTLTLADVPPPPRLLQEDDPFNLVVLSLPHPTIPKEIQLTSSTFHKHIAMFSKTVVVFCVGWSVQCNVFLHYTAAAHRQLMITKALGVSLATVSCDNYTELCLSHEVTTYPTALLFTPSTINTPKPISGIMDSNKLLLALHQTEEKKHKNSSLAELTPRSLPALLSGCIGLNCALVLWCNGDMSTDTAKTFKDQASNTSHHSDFVFAWINSNEHSHLLSRVVPASATFPAVVALSFKQHSVYFLSVEGCVQTFEGKLTSFLWDISLGTLEASGYLANKEWPPLQPPVSFPSLKKTHRSHRKFTDRTSHTDRTPPNNYHMGHHQHTEL